MANIIKGAAWVGVAILIVDAFGFLAWALSGQHPVDGFYIGAITHAILAAIF